GVAGLFQLRAVQPQRIPTQARRGITVEDLTEPYQESRTVRPHRLDRQRDGRAAARTSGQRHPCGEAHFWGISVRLDGDLATNPVFLDDPSDDNIHHSG